MASCRAGVSASGMKPSAERTRLLVEEGEGGRSEQRRGEDVVVGQARKDRERVTAFRPPLPHPAAIAQAAIEQLENLDVMARGSHVSVGSHHERRHSET